MIGTRCRPDNTVDSARQRRRGDRMKIATRTHESSLLIWWELFSEPTVNDPVDRVVSRTIQSRYRRAPNVTSAESDQRPTGPGVQKASVRRPGSKGQCKAGDQPRGSQPVLPADNWPFGITGLSGDPTCVA